MYALTGWIPEQFRTDEPDFDPRRLWERMRSASRYGDCLLTGAPCCHRHRAAQPAHAAPP